MAARTRPASQKQVTEPTQKRIRSIMDVSITKYDAALVTPSDGRL